jgi:cell wall-associated NlpC family hydrolase
MESISGRFLGYPYVANGLIGSANTPEVFNDSLHAFDCVTYIESVIALAYAGKPGNFSSILKKLRYEDGKVAWNRRNHYMTQWLRNNVRSGLIDRVASRKQTNHKDRLLSVVPGLAPRRERFSCIPKRAVNSVRREMQTGDLIFFASTRPQIDVFHCGLVVRKGEKVFLRHASRGRGGVVEQELDSFLKQNRMAGVILARPVDRSRE